MTLAAQRDHVQVRYRVSGMDCPSCVALAICESLLLALTDLKIIAEQDSRDLLTDAVAAHREAVAGTHSPDMHDAVAAMIERILAGKNSVRHN